MPLTKLKAFLLNALERAVFTWLEVFLGFLLASPAFNDPEVVQLAAVGGIAAALSVLKTAVTQVLGGWAPLKNPVADLGLRAVFTWVQGFLAVMIVAAQSNTLSVAATKAAAVSAVPAVLAVVKGAVAIWKKTVDPAVAVGDVSPSFLSPRVENAHPLAA